MASYSKENPNPVAPWFGGFMLIILFLAVILYVRTEGRPSSALQYTDCQVLKAIIGISCGKKAFYMSEIIGVDVRQLHPGQSNLQCDISLGSLYRSRHLCRFQKKSTARETPEPLVFYRTSNPFAATATVIFSMSAFTSASVSVFSNDWKTKWNAYETRSPFLN
jgi:hypothetical protein